MNFTEDMIREDDEKFHARNVRDELRYCGVYMKDRKNITNLDIRFYAWLFRAALREIENDEK